MRVLIVATHRRHGHGSITAHTHIVPLISTRILILHRHLTDISPRHKSDLWLTVEVEHSMDQSAQHNPASWQGQHSVPSIANPNPFCAQHMQVRRASDNATADIGVLGAGGFANSSAQDAFCAGTTCVFWRIYDQVRNLGHSVHCLICRCGSNTTCVNGVQTYESMP